MYLFIFESIGTQELILIGIVAMIFFGPRRIPEMARKFGKLMADFRNTTNEFKSTWEREVNFEEEKNALLTGDIPPAPVARTENINERNEPAVAPEVRTIDAEEVRATLPQAIEPPPQTETQIITEDVGKGDWL